MADIKTRTRRPTIAELRAELAAEREITKALLALIDALHAVTARENAPVGAVGVTDRQERDRAFDMLILAHNLSDLSDGVSSNADVIAGRSSQYLESLAENPVPYPAHVPVMCASCGHREYFHYKPARDGDGRGYCWESGCTCAAYAAPAAPADVEAIAAVAAGAAVLEADPGADAETVAAAAVAAVVELRAELAEQRLEDIADRVGAAVAARRDAALSSGYGDDTELDAMPDGRPDDSGGWISGPAVPGAGVIVITGNPPRDNVV